MPPHSGHQATQIGAPSAVALDFAPPEVIIRVMLTFDRAADDYLDDCARLQWSPRTIATYRRTYYEFADRLPRDYDVSKVTLDDVRRYLATKTHLAAGTIAGCEAHLSSLFKRLYLDGKIVRNPMDRLPRTRRRRSEDLDVTSVSTDDVRTLLAAAESWPERLALGILCCLGPRRHAVALLRLRDYDQLHGQLRFREKGGKIIWKPVPDDLRVLLDAAVAAGVYAESDYLVPPEGYLVRKGDRDDRVIWRLVKKVAARAGVDTHVHALRAAFAVAYLERERDLVGLQELLGHESSETTRVYLRKLDRQAAMEPVRSFSWGVALLGDGETVESPQFAGDAYASSAAVGAGGFEPPSDEPSPGKPRGEEPASVARSRVARERARLLAELAALDSRDREPEDAQAT